MSALEWSKDQAGNSVAESEAGRFKVQRHGEGRKYWGVTFPDGSYQHNALTQTEAKEQADRWRPDATSVALLERESVEADEADPASVEPVVIRITPAAAVAAVMTDAVDVSIRSNAYSYNDTGSDQRRALSVLTSLAQLRAETENAIREQVEIARSNTGNAWYSNAATWEQVGKALGVTKQSAQARYTVKTP